MLISDQQAARQIRLCEKAKANMMMFITTKQSNSNIVINVNCELKNDRKRCRQLWCILKVRFKIFFIESQQEKF